MRLKREQKVTGNETNEREFDSEGGAKEQLSE